MPKLIDSKYAVNSVETRFDVIGRSYEEAIALYPDARTDAQRILDLLEVKGHEKILEVTCGSGYLSMQIAKRLLGGSLISQDISPVMVALLEAKLAASKASRVKTYITGDMAFPEIENNSIDKAACLGGFHHVEEPIKLLKTISRVLRPGGLFVVGDFADASPVQRYFDDCVHNHTSTGHQGLFLTESQMINMGRFAKLEIVSVERKIMPFTFPSKEDVGVFYQLVHGLEQGTEDAQKDIEKYMGIRSIDRNVSVPMDYIFAKYRKQAGVNGAK